MFTLIPQQADDLEGALDPDLREYRRGDLCLVYSPEPKDSPFERGVRLWVCSTWLILSNELKLEQAVAEYYDSQTEEEKKEDDEWAEASHRWAAEIWNKDE